MKQKYLYLLLILLLVPTSCYKEDFSDCPVLLHVYFESIMDKYIYEDIVDELDLYLYDENRLLVQQHHFTAEQLSRQEYTPALNIEKFGNYTVSAVLNTGQSYTVSGTDNLDMLNVSINTQKGDTVNKRPTDVYYAMKDIPVRDTGIRNQYDTLDLYKNTNHLNVDVSFESRWPDDTDIHGYLKGNNGEFDYKNKTVSGSFRVYLPHTRQSMPQDHLLMNFTTMQIVRNGDLTLYLDAESNGAKEQKYELDIYQYLAKIYSDEEMDQEDIFNIVIIFRSDFSIFELAINNWYLIRQGVEV